MFYCMSSHKITYFLHFRRKQSDMETRNCRLRRRESTLVLRRCQMFHHFANKLKIRGYKFDAKSRTWRRYMLHIDESHNYPFVKIYALSRFNEQTTCSNDNMYTYTQSCAK